VVPAARRNATVEYRYADGQRDLLPKLAGDLVGRRGCDCSWPWRRPGREGCDDTPYRSFHERWGPGRHGPCWQPQSTGGNLTGVTMLAPNLRPSESASYTSWFLKQMFIALLVDPNAPIATYQVHEVQAAGRAIGISIKVVRAGSEREFDAAFANIAGGAGALMVAVSSYFNVHRYRWLRRGTTPNFGDLRNPRDNGGWWPNELCAERDGSVSVVVVPSLLASQLLVFFLGMRHVTSNKIWLRFNSQS
jgi:hypothetical protein